MVYQPFRTGLEGAGVTVGLAAGEVTAVLGSGASAKAEEAGVRDFAAQVNMSIKIFFFFMAVRLLIFNIPRSPGSPDNRSQFIL